MTTSPQTERLHDVRFPGEPDEYRQARDALLSAEIELRRQIETVAAQRRQLPLGGEVPSDYEFQEWDAEANAPRSVRMSELFGEGRDTLFLYSFMWVTQSQDLGFVGPCRGCTSIIDAVDGAARHVAEQIGFAVVAKAPIDRFRAHGDNRGWRHARLLSSEGNTYNVDYGAEDAAGSQWPLATVFTRRDGRIHRFWSSELWLAPTEPGQNPRHVDFMWPLWAILDRTPNGGDAGWMPELEYC